MCPTDHWYIPTLLQSEHAGTGTVIYRVLLRFGEVYWQVTKQVCFSDRPETVKGNRFMTLGQCVTTYTLRHSGLKYHWNVQDLSRHVKRQKIAPCLQQEEQILSHTGKHTEKSNTMPT